MNHLQTHNESASMPVSMAVDAKLTTEFLVAAPGPKKDLDFFRREFEKANLVFYRATKKVADLILDARIALSPDDFKALIGELQFDYSTVQKLIKSASNFRLNDPKNQALLPETWTVRYEIMLMKEQTFRIGVTKGIIHPNCTLADLKALRENMEEPKRKKASTTAEPKGKGTDSTVAKTAETPKPTPAAARADESEPTTKKAAVKAPVNNSGLRVVDSSPAAECAPAFVAPPAMGTATATASAKGRIALVVSQGILDQHKADLDGLLARIEALVKDCDFIGGVGLEVAA
jgi:hypothetical protein